MVAGTRMPLLSPRQCCIVWSVSCLCLQLLVVTWLCLTCYDNTALSTHVSFCLRSCFHCSGYMSRNGIYESWFSMFDLLKIKILLEV